MSIHIDIYNIYVKFIERLRMHIEYFDKGKWFSKFIYLSVNVHFQNLIPTGK